MTARPEAQPTIKIDNAWTRVTEWHFPPGATTGWHRHEMDYVVVPVTTGVLKILGPGGQETLAELTVGEPYDRQEGVEHEVINANDFPFTFIEIEHKTGA